jgi:hypothetical protein
MRTNIQKIADLEAEHLNQRTLAERIGDRLVVGVPTEQAVKAEQASLEAETDFQTLVTELDQRIP